jgi:hypothetical protein
MVQSGWLGAFLLLTAKPDKQASRAWGLTLDMKGSGSGGSTPTV